MGFITGWTASGRGRQGGRCVDRRGLGGGRARCAAVKLAEGDDGEDVLDRTEIEFDEDEVVLDTDELEIKRREGLLGDEAAAAALSPGTPATSSISVEVEVGGKTIVFETGLVARQAAGAVVVRAEQSMMLCTACVEPKAAPSADFLPLRVDFSEKFSAIGKTIGTYLKREGKPSEREVLISRLIDRPLRPMFQEGFFNEVQVLASVFAYDGKVPSDALAICGCSAAIHISKIPLIRAVAAVRLAYLDDEFVVNPTSEQIALSETDIVVAGTSNAVLMIEGVCDFLTEEKILEGVQIAQGAIAKLCGAIEELRVKAGSREKMADNFRRVEEELEVKVEALCGDLDEAVKVIGKKQRESAVTVIKDRVFEALGPTQEEVATNPEAAEALVLLGMTWKKVISQRMRRLIVQEDRRPDGRDCKSVRPIHIIPQFLPTAHGSVLFTRGETQTLAVATLGGEDMAMKQETLDGDNQLRFYLQYNFPPFSVGEVGRVGAPGRREIGHGKLAERAIKSIVPSKEDFPYVMRVESNILESNGSSSMASVCGACLALMDAGVPIARPVAGVAMGLILDGQDVAILTDILGMEDALGDMDFKVAGDDKGITALQMDIKVEGITIDIMTTALAEAKEGRIHILNVMNKYMPSHRPALPDTVPKVKTINIPVKKIGDLIGPGGKQIKAVIEECGGESKVSINIGQEGLVTIMSTDNEVIAKAETKINSIVLEVLVGQKFTGTVTKILPFGAYVEIAPGREAWCHISELEYKRTEKVEDVCKEGDKLEVQVTEVGRGGQFRVSRKPLLPPPPPKPEGSEIDSDSDSESSGNGKPSSPRSRGRDRDHRSKSPRKAPSSANSEGSSSAELKPARKPRTPDDGEVPTPSTESK